MNFKNKLDLSVKWSSRTFLLYMILYESCKERNTENTVSVKVKLLVLIY